MTSTKKPFITLPPWPNKVDGAQLIEQITAAIHEYLVISDEEAVACALWCVSSRLHDVFDKFPRLGITGPEKQCGKSTLLDLIERLVDRAIPMASPSPAVIYRMIEKYSPTLLLDEADTYLHKNEDFRNVLNSGFERNKPTLRCAAKTHEEQIFNTYAPIVYAMIRQPPDTIADRSIEIYLSRKLPTENRKNFRSRTDKERFEELSRKANKWADDNRDLVRAHIPHIPPEFTNRLADKWEPLFTVADIIGDKWPERARESARKLKQKKNKARTSTGEALLSDIRDIFADLGETRLASHAILEKLNNLQEQNWTEDYNQQLKPPKLSALLSPFGIRPTTIRISSAETIKGYKAEDFQDAFERYLPPLAVTPSQPTESKGFLPSHKASRNRKAVTEQLELQEDVTIDLDKTSPITDDA
jgi:putative DNA primase/helicase